MTETLYNVIQPPANNTLQEVTDTIEEIVLFCDDDGVVKKCSVGARRFWNSELLGSNLWELLELPMDNVGQVLAKFPAGGSHDIILNGNDECQIWLMPLPKSIAPNGGLVVTLTVLSHLAELHETFQECLQDNITARKDSSKLFSALFDAAPDPTFLIDEKFIILGANSKALHKFALVDVENSEISLLSLIQEGLHSYTLATLKDLTTGQPWTGELTATNPLEESFPVSATFKKVSLSDQTLFQIILKDLSHRAGLEQDLQGREDELESMDQTLRTVIRSVEEEKMEMREEVLEQVKQYVLPTIDRIAESPSQDLRKSYSGMIKSHFDDMAESTVPEVTDEVLSLSPRQFEICRLIRLGMKGREIAELLEISFETLQSHRKNIRRKLKLRGTDVSLAAYLINRTDFDQD